LNDNKGSLKKLLLLVLPKRINSVRSVFKQKIAMMTFEFCDKKRVKLLKKHTFTYQFRYTRNVNEKYF